MGLFNNDDMVNAIDTRQEQMRHIGIGTFQFTDTMRQYVNEVLESGRISYGPYSQRFETEFAELHDNEHGVLSNSGTSSLLVALQTLKEVHGWQDGDEVIVPAITFVATVNVVLQAGLKPVAVDVESDYYGIDVDRIEQAITDKTRCIIPVHTFGQPAAMMNLWKFLRRSRNEHIMVIEDSCECVGVNHVAQSAGSYSHIACFSFYMAHLITTGVGGMAITSNPEYAKIMRSYVNHGLSFDDLSAQRDRFDPWKLHRDFTFERVGHSFRITELEAALGLAQLEDLQEMIDQRQHNAEYLIGNLSLLEDQEFLQLPSMRPNTENSHMMFPLVCRQTDVRDKLIRYLNEWGIETRRMLPLVNQPVYKGLWSPEDFPVAQWIDANGFYIGIYQDLTQGDLDYIIEKFREFFNGHR